jgi:hypothetical protein
MSDRRFPDDSEESDDNPVIVFDPLNAIADENPDSCIPISISYRQPSFTRLDGSPIPKGFSSLSALRRDGSHSRLIPPRRPDLSAAGRESKWQEIGYNPTHSQKLKKHPQMAIPNPCASISAFGIPLQAPRIRIQRCPSASSGTDYRDLTWALGIRQSKSLFDRPMRLTRNELQQGRDRAIATASIEELCRTQEALNQYDLRHAGEGHLKTEFESQIDGLVYAIENVTAQFHGQVEEHLRRKAGQILSIGKRKLAERTFADLVKARNTEHLTLLHRLQALIRCRDELATNQRAASATFNSSRAIPKRLPPQTQPVPVAASLVFLKRNEVGLGV